MERTVLTKPQRQKLKDIYDQRPLDHASNMLTYSNFRRSVQKNIMGGVLVECGGILWGIEDTGRTSSTEVDGYLWGVDTPPRPRKKRAKTLREYAQREFAVCKPPPEPLQDRLSCGNHPSLHKTGAHSDAVPSGGIPEGIFGQAAALHDCVGVELVALGKPAGDIFRPDHWMYDSMREGSGSYADGGLRYWSELSLENVPLATKATAKVR